MASKKSKKKSKKKSTRTRPKAKKVAKSKKAKSSTRKSGTRRRKSVRRPRTEGRVSTRPSRLSERNRAIDVLGESALRPGSRVLLARTPRLTPTANGFRALERYILALQTSDRAKDRALYTFEVDLRFRLPDGSFFEPDPIPGTVRPPSETDALRRKDPKTKRKETSAHAWRYALRSDIQRALFRIMDAQGISGDSETIRRNMSGMTKEEVRDAFRRMKSQHSFTFRVSIYRAIGQGGPIDGTDEE